MIDKERIIKFYEDRILEHGEHFRALDWNSEESQKLRFHVFEDAFEMCDKRSDFSVLDVGCGFGDFSGFLKERGYKFDYTGYDISPKILEIAKKRYPQAKFELKDILEAKDLKKFDYVFCSGAFNIRYDDEKTHMSWVSSMLQKMYEISNMASVANFLSVSAVQYLSDAEFNKKEYYYFRPEDIVNFSRFVTTRFVLRQDYHPGDFTMYLIKQVGRE